jgi:hypothetical protein
MRPVRAGVLKFSQSGLRQQLTWMPPSSGGTRGSAAAEDFFAKGSSAQPRAETAGIGLSDR